MGYFEIQCQLCGVSFAIARIRRPDEPIEAAWDYWGYDCVTVDPCLTRFRTDAPQRSLGCSTQTWMSQHDGELEEHLAGPNCTATCGYSGHRISLEEMKGCRAVQCILTKTPEWEPEEDDQDFELDSNHFLTGIGDGSPDEAPLSDLQPVRHGNDDVLLTNTPWNFVRGARFIPILHSTRGIMLSDYQTD